MKVKGVCKICKLWWRDLFCINKRVPRLISAKPRQTESIGISDDVEHGGRSSTRLWMAEREGLKGGCNAVQFVG